MKKLLIIGGSILGVLVLSIVGLFIYVSINSKPKKEVKTTEATTVAVNVIDCSVSPDVSQSAGENEISSQNGDETMASETENKNAVINYQIIEETTTAKRKIKRKKHKKHKHKKEIETTKTPETSVIKKPIKIPVVNPTKPTKPKKAQKPKPQTKALGSYSESNVLSSSKVSIIRNSIFSRVGGTNSEKTNLARYMSARGLSNATSAYRGLTNSNKTFSARVASTSIESDTQTNILSAASKLAGKIGKVSGTCGVGVSSFRQKVGYRIYVVVVH